MKREDAKKVAVELLEQTKAVRECTDPTARKLLPLNDPSTSFASFKDSNGGMETEDFWKLLIHLCSSARNFQDQEPDSIGTLNIRIDEVEDRLERNDY